MTEYVKVERSVVEMIEDELFRVNKTAKLTPEQAEKVFDHFLTERRRSKSKSWEYIKEKAEEVEREEEPL